MRWVVRIACVAVAASVGAPAAASAASVQVVQAGSQARLSFEAAAGEQNAITVALASQDPGGNRYTVRDTGAAVSPGAGCTGGGSPGATVTCLVPRSRQGTGMNDFGLRVILEFGLADGNDLLDATALPASDGGSSDFSLEATGGDGADTLQTGPMRDRIDPGGGTDTVSSGAGDDFADAGAAADGADVYDLGTGSDGVSYGLRTTPVTIDLLDPRAVGAPGENDSVFGVETVSGGQAADRIAGTDSEAGELAGGREVLYGGNGEDMLIGRRGPDSLLAGPLHFGGPTIPATDDDVSFRGGRGADVVSGSGGDDDANGGAGDDSISLGAGDDFAAGDKGSDEIMGWDGADRLRGGRGRDWLDAAQTLLAEADDDVDRLACGRSRRDKAVSVEPRDSARGCERVKVAD